MTESEAFDELVVEHGEIASELKMLSWYVDPDDVSTHRRDGGFAVTLHYERDEYTMPRVWMGHLCTVRDELGTLADECDADETRVRTRRERTDITLVYGGDDGD